MDSERTGEDGSAATASEPSPGADATAPQTKSDEAGDVTENDVAAADIEGTDPETAARPSNELDEVMDDPARGEALENPAHEDGAVDPTTSPEATGLAGTETGSAAADATTSLTDDATIVDTSPTEEVSTDPYTDRPDAETEFPHSRVGRDSDTSFSDNATTTTVPPAAAPSGGGGLFGSLLAGIAGAVIVGLIAWAAGLIGPPSAPPTDNRAELQQEIDDLRSELTQLSEAGSGTSGVPSEDIADLQAQLDELQSAVQTQSEQSSSGGDASADLSGFEERIAALESGSATSGAGGQAAQQVGQRVDGLETQLADLAEAVRTNAQSIEQSQSAIQSARSASEESSQTLAGLSEQITGLSDRNEEFAERLSNVEELAQSASEQEGVARTIALTALSSAVEQGQPFATELQTASTLVESPDARQTLEQYADQGVASRAQLRDEVSNVAADLSDAARPQLAEDAGMFDRLRSAAGSLVQVRRTGDVQGEEPDAVIARFEAAVERGELQQALGEFETLPEDVRQSSEAYAERLRDRIEVDRALMQFASSGEETPTDEPAGAASSEPSAPSEEGSEAEAGSNEAPSGAPAPDASSDASAPSDGNAEQPAGDASGTSNQPSAGTQ